MHVGVRLLACEASMAGYWRAGLPRPSRVGAMECRSVELMTSCGLLHHPANEPLRQWTELGENQREKHGTLQWRVDQPRR